MFEHDFTDKDMVKEIYEGPCGKERFELELAARLAVRISTTAKRPQPTVFQLRSSSKGTR